MTNRCPLPDCRSRFAAELEMTIEGDIMRVQADDRGITFSWPLAGCLERVHFELPREVLYEVASAIAHPRARRSERIAMVEKIAAYTTPEPVNWSYSIVPYEGELYPEGFLLEIRHQSVTSEGGVSLWLEASQLDAMLWCLWDSDRTNSDPS